MIPTVRLDHLVARVPETLEVVRRATREVGIFYVDSGSGDDRSTQRDLFAAARRFFALPVATKQRLTISQSPNYRGYVGIGEESTNGKADLKESLEFGKETAAPPVADPPPYFQMYGGNQWPDDADLPGFRSVVDAYTAYVERVGVAVVEGLASTLGQTRVLGGADAPFGDELCWFSRIIYYSHPAEFDQEDVRLDAHTDSGMVTVSLQDCPGLEVRARSGGWLEVNPPEGACVVFTGELMELWSRGYYPACVHRVHNKALRSERSSVITFFIPDLRSVLTPLDAASSPVLAGTGALQPFVVGEREWERMHAIFPDDLTEEQRS